MECFESLATFEGRIVRERVYFYQDTNIFTYIFESEIHESGYFFAKRELRASSSHYSGR